MWPEPKPLRDKLYGSLEKLKRTAAFGGQQACEEEEDDTVTTLQKSLCYKQITDQNEQTTEANGHGIKSQRIKRKKLYLNIYGQKKRCIKQLKQTIRTITKGMAKQTNKQANKTNKQTNK